MAPRHSSEQSDGSAIPDWEQRIENSKEAVAKLIRRLRALSREWQRISTDPDTLRRFEEMFGKVGDNMSLVSRTLQRLPNQVKGTAFGGVAGVIIGFLLGGGGVGVAAFGGAIGVPLVVITGLLGAFAGKKFGHEVEFCFEQWVKAFERRIQAFNQIENDRLHFESVRDIDHWTVFEQAFGDAQRRLCIRSGSIGANVVDEPFIGRLEVAIERGVVVIIEYGTEGNIGSVLQSASRKSAIRRLDALQRRASARRLSGTLHHGATRTHVKELAVDQTYAIVGSFNWLSERRGECKESSVKIYSAALADQIHRDAVSSLKHVGAI